MEPTPTPSETGACAPSVSGPKRQAFRWGAVFLVLLLCILVRWFDWQHTHIINPDGTLYIDQAKLILQGELEKTTLADLRFLSPYPFAIAATRMVTADWESAARAVSMLFGTLTLIPLFFLLRKFLSFQAALGTLFIFALIPTFVTNSVEVVRGPMAWFFATAGLYFMVQQMSRWRPWATLLAGTGFVLAAWTRVEMALLFGLSLLFLLLEPHGRIRKCLVFCLPLAIFIGLILAASQTGEQKDMNAFRMAEITAKPGGPLQGYHDVREGLSSLTQEQPVGPLRLFLQNVRGHVLLVGLAELVSTLVKAVHYPFALFFLLAIGPLRRQAGGSRPILYLALAFITGLGVLYAHLLETWVSETRFFPLVLLPGAVILGLGLERSIDFLSSRLHLGRNTALVILLFATAALVLPKNLQERESDKIVFKEIGAAIAAREEPHGFTLVAASEHIQRWISFYANPSYEGPTSITARSKVEALLGGSYRELMANLRANRVQYLLWEEKHWPAGYDLLESLNGQDLELVGRWEHPDTGVMMLYEVRP